MNLQVGVKILLQDDAGKYLFIRREPSFKAGPQKWDIPGGRIESDEALLEALKREVKEETNMELVSVDKLIAAQDIFAEDKNLHVVRLTYTGKALGAVGLSSEHDDHRWMTREEILAEEHVDSYLREVLS